MPTYPTLHKLYWGVLLFVLLDFLEGQPRDTPDDGSPQEHCSVCFSEDAR